MVRSLKRQSNRHVPIAGKNCELKMKEQPQRKIMGRPRWEPNISDLSDAISENKGNITIIAKKLGTSRDTLHEYVRAHPEVKELIEKARVDHGHDELDLAVSLNYYFMQQFKENPSLASKHVMYTLDRKGHSRGYVKTEPESIVGNYESAITSLTKQKHKQE